jgi:hypothetical protein
MVPQVSPPSSATLKYPSVTILAAPARSDEAAEHSKIQLVQAHMIVVLETRDILANQVDLVHLLERDAVVRMVVLVGDGEMELQVVQLWGRERRFRGGV